MKKEERWERIERYLENFSHPIDNSSAVRILTSKPCLHGLRQLTILNGN